MKPDEPDRRAKYLKRWKALENERNTWLEHWREIADHTRPRSFRYLPSDRSNAGTKKNQKLLNGKPRRALRTLAAGMMAGITSPSRPWFRFVISDSQLMNEQSVLEYLAELEKLFVETLQKSNIYNAFHNVYEDLGGFGTSVLHVESDDEDTIRAYNFPVGQYCLANSARQAVDSVYRKFEMSVAQLAEQFGLEKCSEGVKEKHRAGNIDAYVEVLHVLEPNRDHEGGALGVKGKKYRSVWLEVAGDITTGFLREGGFHEFPAMCPRWETTGEDVYGTGPGMDALGDCKALQLMEKRKAQLVDKLVNPPMKGSSALMNKRVSTLPGDITYDDASTPNAMFQPVYQVNPQGLPAIRGEIDSTERAIAAAFFADLFLMISESDGQMTATEVVERRSEKLLQLGPVMERLQDEFLDPFFQRAFSIMADSGKLPPPPLALQGRDLAIEYISILAQAQKLLGTTAVERLTTFIGNLSRVVPSVLDKLNVDATVDEYSKMLGGPPKMVRPDDEVAALRAQRAKQEAQQQQMMAAQAAAGTAKDLAAADTGGDNALTTMLRGFGAA